jgi:hypothetical protein
MTEINPEARPENAEKRPARSFLDLFCPSGETNGEIRAFRQRVSSNGGLVYLFVHPLDGIFNAEEMHRSAVERFRIKDPEIAEVMKGLREILADETGTTPICIIMESAENLDDTATRLTRSIRHPDNFFYVVPTGDSDPVPRLGSDSDNVNWDKFADKLRELGVRKIVLGGKYFCATKGNPEGCVTATRRELSQRGLEVQVSKLTHPDRGDVEISGLKTA